MSSAKTSEEIGSADGRRRVHVTMAAPRGCCAGVDRGIEIVERCLEQYGAPVYVRHEIVHNRFVVSQLQSKGVIFVDSLEDIPSSDHTRPVVFSAHGVPQSVLKWANARKLHTINATCPLVEKVHAQVRHAVASGEHVLLIGHRGHAEVVGTMGQTAPGTVTLIETLADARAFVARITDQDHRQRGRDRCPERTQIDSSRLTYCTQTTLAWDDVIAIVSYLKTALPDIRAPKRDDICYATTNRQKAVREIASDVDVMLIVGSETSSNSKRLVEVAYRSGCAHAQLVDGPEDIPFAVINARFAAQASVVNVGLSAGASAPEALTQRVLARLCQEYACQVSEVVSAREDTTFRLPRTLERPSERSATGQ